MDVHKADQSAGNPEASPATRVPEGTLKQFAQEVYNLHHAIVKKFGWLDTLSSLIHELSQATEEEQLGSILLNRFQGAGTDTSVRQKLSVMDIRRQLLEHILPKLHATYDVLPKPEKKKLGGFWFTANKYDKIYEELDAVSTDLTRILRHINNAMKDKRAKEFKEIILHLSQESLHALADIDNRCKEVLTALGIDIHYFEH